MNLELEEQKGLSPITSDQKRKIYELRAAYADFWNNRKFKKGWAKPLFDYGQVEELLDEAAEIVVRIREHLDEVSLPHPHTTHSISEFET